MEHEKAMHMSEKLRIGEFFQSKVLINTEKTIQLQPIFEKKKSTEMVNSHNDMMDHVRDGFYAGQQRLQRFPALIQAGRGSVINVNMTGAPAKQMQFTIHSQARLLDLLSESLSRAQNLEATITANSISKMRKTLTLQEIFGRPSR